MSIRKRWQQVRPIVRWGAFLLLLAAVGTVHYWLLQPEPRWLRAEEPMAVFNAGSGQIALHPHAGEHDSGPLRLLDAATGEETGRFLNDADLFTTYGRSDDGRFFVGICKSPRPNIQRLFGVDLGQKREWQVDMPLGTIRSPLFSPAFDFVALHVDPKDDKGEWCAVVETATGRVVTRLHVPNGFDHLSFTGDGRYLVLGYHDEDDTHYIRAVNTRTAKVTSFDDARVMAVPPDGPCLIADRGEDGVWVADLDKASWRCPLEGAQSRENDIYRLHHLEYWNINSIYVSGDIRLSHARKIRTVYNFLSGRSGRFVLRSGPSDRPIFSPDARTVLWPVAQTEPARLTLYDIATGQPRWRQTQEVNASDFLFTPDGRRIVLTMQGGDRLEVRSAATGELERTIPLTGLADLDLRPSRDGRTITVGAVPTEDEPHWLWAKVLEWLPERPESPMLIRAIDMDTGQPLGQLAVEETGEFWLTDDRGSLITIHHESEDGAATATTIRCWDMPPRRPLRRIALVLPALALALLSLRLAWHRLRSRKLARRASEE
jgi:hypothetical protein